MFPVTLNVAGELTLSKLPTEILFEAVMLVAKTFDDKLMFPAIMLPEIPRFPVPSISPSTLRNVKLPNDVRKQLMMNYQLKELATLFHHQ